MSKSKYTVSKLWDLCFSGKSDVIDYSGRRILKRAIGNVSSEFHPTIDHIRPLSSGGKDVVENIVICSVITNREKGNNFNTWKANGKTFQASRMQGNRQGYVIFEIIKDDK